MKTKIKLMDEETKTHFTEEIGRRLLAIPKRRKGEKKERLVETLEIGKTPWPRRLIWLWEDEPKRQARLYLVGVDEQESLWIRNGSFNGAAGWMFKMPGDLVTCYSFGMPGQKVRKEDFYGYKGRFNPCTIALWTWDEAREAYPSIKYIRLDSYDFLDLKILFSHPEAEFLYKLGLRRIAKSRWIWQLHGETAKAVRRWMARNPEEAEKHEGDYRWIIAAAKGKQALITYEARKRRAQRNREFLQAYLTEQNEPDYFYRDYLAMAKKEGYDLNDRKHRFPRDLKAAHDALCAVKEKKEMEETVAGIEEATARFAPIQGEIGNGFAILLPKDYEDFKEQAEEMGNCLISNQYFKKYARGDDVIVFVYKNGKRAGTAELYAKDPSRFGQFTANQKKPDCRPPKEMEAAVTQWRDDVFAPFAARLMKQKAKKQASI